MVLPGETINKKRTKCVDCQRELELGVQRSAAGYYLGFWCDVCGPYSRESDYYETRAEAQEALEKNEFGRY